MVKNSDLKKIINMVAEEQNYNVKEVNTKTQLYLDGWHTVAFEIRENSTGYLQAHPWESVDENGDGRYGRAVYSLRSVSDVIQFCSIIISSSKIRAKRKE